MVCILDFSFKPDMMKRIEARTKNIVWCDHHASAKAYGYNYGGVQDFSQGGLCGAECTWKHFLPDAPIPEGLELLGDYDSWRMKRRSESLPFYEGLKLYDTSPKTGVWRKLLRGDTMPVVKEILTSGTGILNYRDRYCADMRTSYGYETLLAGHKAFAMNIYRFGSAQFGPLFDEYPLCIAYIYDGKAYTVSLYSTKVDCAEIAKQLGGGGHKGAAGFVCEKLPFDRTGVFGDA